jgi:hypothetical protein
MTAQTDPPTAVGSNAGLGVVRWGGTDYKAAWRLVCENADTAQDPREARYRLHLVGADGRTIARDAVVTDAEHGVWKRLRDAMGLPMLRLVPGVTLPDTLAGFDA